MQAPSARTWLRVAAFIGVGLLFALGWLLFPEDRFKRRMIPLSVVGVLVVAALIEQAMRRRRDDDAG